MSNCFLSCIAILWALCPFYAHAGKVKGKILDKKGEALPFATVYAKELGTGTTSNEQGEYLLTLPAGKHTIVFQYVGFQAKYFELTLENETVTLDVTLEAEEVSLEEVSLSAQERDPAYAIIRQAQAKRRFYLKQEIKSYKTQAYIKSFQRLNKKPSSFMGQTIRIDTGVVYFSESLSELSFKQPDHYAEKLISSKVSGNSQAFSFNQASKAWLNLYENITGEELAERGVVSPIASNALAYYRYRLIGAFYQDGVLINKIQLIPKRKNAPAYGGYLYIIEGSWRIHSAELMMKKGQVEFVDSASVHQVYAPVKGTDVWFPLTQKAYFEFNAFGFKGNGNMIFVYSPPQLEPVFEKKHFNQDVFVVEKESNKRDTAHWNTIRPIPLTKMELKDYKMKDSIAIVKETKVYKDSVDKNNNKFRPLNLFFRGYTLRNTYRKLTFSFDALPTTAQYNTIEGFVLDFSPTLRKGYGEDNRKNFTISPTVRYGFVNHRLQAKIDGSYYFNPKKWQYFSFSGGQYVEQLSRQASIRPFANTIYTLFDEQNFLKMYEKTYLNLAYGHRIIKGFRINGSVEWNERRQMQNNANDKIRDVNNRVFTSNTPFNAETNETNFATHKSFIMGLVVTVNFGQKYAVYPEYIYTVESKYPTIRLNYRKALPILGSNLNYDFLFLQINDSWSLGLVGESEWEVEVGKFLSSKNMQFIDYRHFLGNQTLFGRQDIRQYHLLDYYTYSTRDQYVKAHYEHHFNGFFLNGIPLIRRLKWQEVVSANFLYTPTLGQYYEIGLGIEHIFKVLRVDWVMAFQTNKPINTGLRFGIGF